MSTALQSLRRALPLVTAAAGEPVRVRIGEVEAGGGDPVIIAGPCAVEDLGGLLRTARRVKAAGAHGLRGGAYKPRSSPYSFQGLGGAALEMLAAAKIETGLFLAVEVMSGEEAGLVADYADLLQIGARNMQNFPLLRAVGRCNRPVLLKRGLSATMEEWLQAAEYIMAAGNPRVILCERGIRTFSRMTRNTFDLAVVPLAQRLTGLPVFADPSHATGRRDLVAPMCRAALAAGADGLLIEVHPEPERALSDGAQSLNLDEFDDLLADLAAGRLVSRRREREPGPDIRPGLDECLDLAEQGCRHIPFLARIAAEDLTPLGVYRRLARNGPAFLLESVEPGGAGVGRYSFYGDRPLLSISAGDDRVTLRRDGEERSVFRGDILRILQEVMADLAVAPLHGLLRFFGGAVGYLGYDYACRIEPVPSAAPHPLGLPVSEWMVPERLVVMDHVTNQVSLIVLAAADAEGHKKAGELIRETVAALRAPAPPLARRKAGLAGAISSSLSEEEYCRAVVAAKEDIAAGEIFQAVLSQRLTLDFHGDPLDLYQSLRAENPSPYLFLLNFGPYQLIGSSPEMLVRLENGQAETRPLAGTRPRGTDAEADRRLEEELRADPKERAEHLMLVDLGRNDLGRVCRYGSVQVPLLMQVERYAQVMHLVSHVTGELADGQDAFSLLRATFPAGTLSGAPKVRAMQIIAGLEPDQRGAYGGAVGYIGFNGNMDTCITIRTVALRDGRACIQAGAGIVADSEPEREYAESLQKAKAVLRAIHRAKGLKE